MEFSETTNEVTMTFSETEDTAMQLMEE